ncbi:alpha/beta hydrolase [Bifidobacterium sp. ESL0704]|uniref:alpha/beta hydrolase n=1 Tax=Bifidobacterium sp. ESL0704 TaxID=2983219 RepID=UPI0023F63BC1|nr:alpha/beta hydrolase [Bifidobacterium sp. ESL0704]WEV53080.1 alpha/beta hydrolase [Bifidobacterium sp. ESL0704]
MQYITKTIKGIDGSEASLTGYIIDNSKEIDPDRRRPAVLIFPGGGFNKVTDREAEPIAMMALGAGVQAFVLRYSIAPSRYPVQMLEGAEAMKLIRDNAKEWHVDPQAVTVIGFSCGGQLAASMATTTGDDVMRANGYDPDAVRANGLALGYPVLTAGEYRHEGTITKLLGDKKSDQKMLDEISCEKHVDAKTAPTFIWQTITDAVVPVQNSLLFINACVEAGVSVEAHLFPQGPHSLALATTETAAAGNAAQIEPSAQVWPSLWAAWIKRNFAK